MLASLTTGERQKAVGEKVVPSPVLAPIRGDLRIDLKLTPGDAGIAPMLGVLSSEKSVEDRIGVFISKDGWGDVNICEN